MAIELDESEQVSIPPSGKRLIFVDTDGTTKQLLSTGAKSSMGGGGAVSVDGVTIGGDGTVGDPLEVIAGLFGSDVLVSLPNSAAAEKTVSEWVSAYVSNTAGAEQSSVTIKVLQAGAQVTGLKLLGQDATQVGDFLTFINDSDTGFIGSGNAIFVKCGNVVVGTWNGAGMRLAGIPLLMSASGASLTYAGGTVALKPDTSVGNVDLGLAAGALATNATHGFPTIPSCAGTPTGTPTPTSGQIPVIVDTTNNKLYGFYGAAWHDLTG